MDTPVAAAVLERTRHALTELDPSTNPYVHWILTGTHGESLPYALRPEHFETIRANLDRLEWHCVSLEEFVERSPAQQFDRLNLSDVFEYVSPAAVRAAARGDSCDAAGPGARLAYWNMLVPRRRPDHLAGGLRSLDTLAERSIASDRAFFYGAFRVEEVRQEVNEEIVETLRIVEAVDASGRLRQCGAR